MQKNFHIYMDEGKCDCCLVPLPEERENWHFKGELKVIGNLMNQPINQSVVEADALSFFLFFFVF